MKRRGNNTQYNRNLFIILIVAAVVICSVAAGVYLLSEKDVGNETEKEYGDDTDSEDNGDKKGGGKSLDNNKQSIFSESLKKKKVDTSEEIQMTTKKPEVVEQKDKESEKEQPKIQEPETEQPKIQEPAITDVDGDWNLVLVNPWNKLPEGFTVVLAETAGGHKVDARIVDDLNAMMNDLAKEGLSAFVCSSYRTNTKQTTLYNNEVSSYKNLGYSDEEAAIEAAKWVAIPGTSEHQTGLAVDIMSNHYLKLDEGQEDTEEQKWLMNNSWKYGFILRYPNNKSEITGIYYEPWHYRYVGKDAAKEIYDRGICFEEYLLG